MQKKRTTQLEFEIDRLTNSIKNILTGEVFDTDIRRISIKESKQIKKTEWLFDWHEEIREKSNEVYKLTTANNPKIIQGLLSIEDINDHIFMHLIESANFNKGKNKVYLGVPGNLVAFACKVSFEKGYEGFVAFDSKTALIKHYQQTLGAIHFRGQRMYMDTIAAGRLVSKYFKT